MVRRPWCTVCLFTSGTEAIKRGEDKHCTTAACMIEELSV